ncbi:MAG TPA: hypothetical protein VK708_21255 [Bryobacteraceae bacterium]|jgi:hypothetical protein|nr:hypothetical protein [Bryobacteraceae bacterium]
MSSAPAVPREQNVSEPLDRAVLERATRRYLQMSSEEFVEKWNSGFFKQHPELAHKADDIALLLPLLSA